MAPLRGLGVLGRAHYKPAEASASCCGSDSPANNPVIPVCAVVLVIGVIALVRCDREDIADVLRALLGRKPD
jgi:hypothetical protein